MSDPTLGSENVLVWGMEAAPGETEAELAKQGHGLLTAPALGGGLRDPGWGDAGPLASSAPRPDLLTPQICWPW